MPEITSVQQNILSITNGRDSLVDVDDALYLYLTRLHDLPFVTAVEPRRFDVLLPTEPMARRFDGELQIETPTETFLLPFELLRSHLSRANAERVIALSATAPNLVLFAPSIGRDLGAKLHSAGVNYIDLAGNCSIKLGGAYVAHVSGRVAPTLRGKDKGMRAPAFRVLFALMAKPELIAQPTREIARWSGGVSPQTVADVRDRLVNQELVFISGRTHRWAPASWVRLLQLWLSGANSTLYPSLFLGRFRAPEKDLQAVETNLTRRLSDYGEWAWGGGVAAHRLTKFYRGDRTVLYLAEEGLRALHRQVRLAPDREGPIWFYRAPGPLAFEADHTVHPLLAYTDLIQESHDRAREAAEQLYERTLQSREAT